MDGTRLLERIRAMESASENTDEFTPTQLLESILNHLSSVFNTRQESAIIGEEFGIPDFSSLNSSFDADEISTIETSLLNVVTRYEKRIKNAKVNFVPDPKEPLKMQFALSGELVHQGSALPIVFETVLTPTGRITIKQQGDSF